MPPNPVVKVLHFGRRTLGPSSMYRTLHVRSTFQTRGSSVLTTSIKVAPAHQLPSPERNDPLDLWDLVF